MRNVTRLTVLLVCLAGLSSITWAQCNTNGCNPGSPDRRTISVTGTAQVTTDADLAVVRVGYRLFGPDAKSAYDQAVATSNTIMNALTAAGIPNASIESTSQVLQHTPPYEMQQFPNQKNEEQFKERQFTVTQSWTIRVKPDQAATALNTAVDAGANESGWIQWIVEDPSAMHAKASAEAVANARKIAEEIAAKSGVGLGHLVSVNENLGQMPYNVFAANVSGSVYGMGDGVSLAGGMPMPNQPLAINSRRVEFHATVSAVFAIEDAATPAK
jgi:uncharacterized protein YggE